MCFSQSLKNECLRNYNMSHPNYMTLQNIAPTTVTLQDTYSSLSKYGILTYLGLEGKYQ